MGLKTRKKSLVFLYFEVEDGITKGVLIGASLKIASFGLN